MSNPTKKHVFAAAILIVISSGALACGESLYRIGKGVAYRAYSAPIPADVLVYVDTERDRQIAALLEGAGHGVQLVEDDESLRARLNSNEFDVVIAPFRARELVSRNTSITFLPVVSDGSTDQRQARDLKLRPLTTDDDVKKYLKEIHRGLKRA